MILIHTKNLQKCLYKIEKVYNEKLKLSLNSKIQIWKVQNGIDFMRFRHVLTLMVRLYGKCVNPLNNDVKAFENTK